MMFKKKQIVCVKSEHECSDSFGRTYKIVKKIPQVDNTSYLYLGVDTTDSSSTQLISDCRYRVYQDVLFDIDY